MGRDDRQERRDFCFSDSCQGIHVKRLCHQKHEYLLINSIDTRDRISCTLCYYISNCCISDLDRCEKSSNPLIPLSLWRKGPDTCVSPRVETDSLEYFRKDHYCKKVVESDPYNGLMTSENLSVEGGLWEKETSWHRVLTDYTFRPWDLYCVRTSK